MFSVYWTLVVALFSAIGFAYKAGSKVATWLSAVLTVAVLLAVLLPAYRAVHAPTAMEAALTQGSQMQSSLEFERPQELSALRDAIRDAEVDKYIYFAGAKGVGKSSLARVRILSSCRRSRLTVIVTCRPSARKSGKAACTSTWRPRPTAIPLKASLPRSDTRAKTPTGKRRWPATCSARLSARISDQRLKVCCCCCPACMLAGISSRLAVCGRRSGEAAVARVHAYASGSREGQAHAWPRSDDRLGWHERVPDAWPHAAV